jgi:sortase A
MDRTERRRRRDSWLRLAERALVGVALLALGWYAAVHVIATLDRAAQNRVLDRFGRPASGIAARVGKHKAPPHAEGSTAIRLADPTPRSVVGRIEIPRLGMSAIVREGVDNSTLRRAVGHVPQTALPGESGNAALAAHRDTFFRPLKDVRKGDRITVTTREGVHEYRVTETRVVTPDDVSVLAPTMNPTLTLVTCYPFNFMGTAPKRFVVRAQTDTPFVAAAGVPATIIQPVPIKASAAISEPGDNKSALRRPTRRSGVTKTAKSKRAKSKLAAGRTKPGAETPTAAVAETPKTKVGPFKKFLRLFTGRPKRQVGERQ